VDLTGGPRSCGQHLEDLGSRAVGQCGQEVEASLMTLIDIYR
jgi:hypothetical protein